MKMLTEAPTIHETASVVDCELGKCDLPPF